MEPGGADYKYYNSDLFLVGLGGRHWQKLTHTPATAESDPTISTSGNRIAHQRSNISKPVYHTLFESNLSGSAAAVAQRSVARTACTTPRHGGYAPLAGSARSSAQGPAALARASAEAARELRFELRANRDHEPSPERSFMIKGAALKNRGPRCLALNGRDLRVPLPVRSRPPSELRTQAGRPS